MEREIIDNGGFITHALTIEGKIVDADYINFALTKDGPFYWSEVYCEVSPAHCMYRLIRKGMLLYGATPEQLEHYLEQTKVNTRYHE